MGWARHGLLPPKITSQRGGPSRWPGSGVAGAPEVGRRQEGSDVSVLDGRTAIVTGASRGIGADTARRLAAEGARVAVAARTVQASEGQFSGTIHDTVDGIRAAGGTAVPIAANLAKPEDRERMVTEARSQLGPIDICVNNAAVTYFTPIEDFNPRRYDLMFEVQVKAAMHLAQLVLPDMRERGGGWILNISSIAAVHPTMPPTQRAARGGTVYGMCKAALERLSTGLAAELYGDGVAVNALSPNQVVPTPGTLFHRLTTEEDPNSEPPAVMAEAALALCGGAPPGTPRDKLTGRVTYSQDLLGELGIPAPVG